MHPRVEADDSGSTRRARAKIAARIEALLWLIGATTLAVALWMVGDAVWYQHRAAEVLTATWRAESTVSRAAAPGGPAMQQLAPAPGTPIARLSIPRLDISAIVAEGVDTDVLRHALGHVPTSALPGENGNVALAGHRDTFFRSLCEVGRGDLIRLDSVRGRDTYQVEWAAVVEPSQVVLTGDAGYPALTLVTCYPFHYVGDAPYRYVIRARRLEASAAAPRAAG